MFKQFNIVKGQRKFYRPPIALTGYFFYSVSTHSIAPRYSRHFYRVRRVNFFTLDLQGQDHSPCGAGKQWRIRFDKNHISCSDKTLMKTLQDFACIVSESSFETVFCSSSSSSSHLLRQLVEFYIYRRTKWFMRARVVYKLQVCAYLTRSTRNGARVTFFPEQWVFFHAACE